MRSDRPNDAFADHPANFRTTHWSVVLKAGNEDAVQCADALERLCRAYWHPIYAFVRRRGYSADEAKDHVQGFFAALLQRKGLERVDPDKGRFRTFLLASVTHFLANEWQKQQTQKRGGGYEFLSLDAASEEERYQLEPMHHLTPERLFEQRWAHAVLERVVTRLEQEFDQAGHGDRYECLKAFLSGDGAEISYADAARNLNVSVGAVTSIIHRMRQRYRELFRDEISQTVENPAEVDDEIRCLIAALTP